MKKKNKQPKTEILLSLPAAPQAAGPVASGAAAAAAGVPAVAPSAASGTALAAAAVAVAAACAVGQPPSHVASAALSKITRNIKTHVQNKSTN